MSTIPYIFEKKTVFFSYRVRSHGAQSGSPCLEGAPSDQVTQDDLTDRDREPSLHNEVLGEPEARILQGEAK